MLHFFMWDLWITNVLLVDNWNMKNDSWGINEIRFFDNLKITYSIDCPMCGINMYQVTKKCYMIQIGKYFISATKNFHQQICFSKIMQPRVDLLATNGVQGVEPLRRACDFSPPKTNRFCNIQIFISRIMFADPIIQIIFSSLEVFYFRWCVYFLLKDLLW